MAHGKAALRQPAADVRVQFQQPHAIGDRRAALADFLRDILLPQAEFLGQPREGQRFFDRVQVLALQVLDERELQHLLVGRRADNGRRLQQADLARRAPAALPGDELILAIPLPHDERLDDAVLADGIDQLLQLLAAELRARLERRGDDEIQPELLHPLARFLRGRGRGDALVDERAESFSESELGRHGGMVFGSAGVANSLSYFSERSYIFRSVSVAPGARFF